jgi:DnaJ like chaperone protein
MAWIGKVTGGILGYAAARLVGAVIGVVLGHQFDRGMSRDRPRQGRRSGTGAGAGPAADRQRVLFETTFLLMGRLAKLDGRVSEAEIGAAREVMRHMRLNERQVRLAIDLFTAGKQADYPIDEQVERFRRYCADDRYLVRMFLEALLDFVVVRGDLTGTEREFLDGIASRVGVDRLEFAGIEALLRARRGFMGGSPGASRESGLDLAYRALGIEPGASDEEVKKAYRRLMNEHHPDKLVARGLPETMLEKAKERTSEILAAYETIKAHRGLK